MKRVNQSTTPQKGAQNQAVMRRLCASALVLLGILLFILFQFRTKSFSFAHIHPDLEAPSTISRLYLEIDDGSGSLPLEISDPEQIRRICAALSKVEVLYQGDYSGMEYSPETGDFIIAIHMRTPSGLLHIYVKQDGTVCDNTSCYQANGDTISEFYQSILETYYIP